MAVASPISWRASPSLHHHPCPAAAAQPFVAHLPPRPQTQHSQSKRYCRAVVASADTLIASKPKLSYVGVNAVQSECVFRLSHNCLQMTALLSSAHLGTVHSLLVVPTLPSPHLHGHLGKLPPHTPVTPHTPAVWHWWSFTAEAAVAASTPAGQLDPVMSLCQSLYVFC